MKTKKIWPKTEISTVVEITINCEIKILIERISTK